MTTRETAKHLEHFNRDTEWYRAHRDELLARYPDQWIAIYGEEVVGAAEDAEELIAELQERWIPIGHTFFANPTGEEEDWIVFS
jgi:hypothetical protein